MSTTTKINDERIAACNEIARLRAEIARQETHRNNAVEAERAHCVKALTTLSGAGICPPEGTYGTATYGAMSTMVTARIWGKWQGCVQS